MNAAWCDPVLSCAEAKALEARLFGGKEDREWEAMQRAGAAVAAAVLDDFRELGGFPAAGRILVLAGKGHNGGDALLAAREILQAFPAASADVSFAFGERALRPLAARAWRQLLSGAGLPARVHSVVMGKETQATAYDVCLDGIFGYQFRPPLDAATAELINQINAHPAIRLRAAVDLPSGLGGAKATGAFRADFTYATGVVKSPAIDSAHAASVGRLRYLDLGFFSGAWGGTGDPGVKATDLVLKSSILKPLAALRPAESDKRSFGHLLVVGGSRHLPGAALMTVRAALRSGAGLVTGFVPESLAAAYAATTPEAMWVGLPETPGGGLALEGGQLLRERSGRATALVLGPGLGQEAETLVFATDVVAHASVPLVLDADALRPEIVRAGTAPRILTPHQGEYARIAGTAVESDRPFGEQTVVVRKGRLTRVGRGVGPAWWSPFGGPVLARGGSGDLLAGLLGGLLAVAPGDPMAAACRGVVWHGRAADLLARAHGQTAVTATQLLDFLPQAVWGAADER